MTNTTDAAGMTTPARPALSPTPRSTVGRLNERALLDRAALDDVLDTGLICHLGIVVDGAPLVLPTVYGRDGDTLYIHGSTAARTLVHGAAGAPACITVTHLDGIIYARSAFRHSMNYRSAVVHGSLQRIEDRDDLLHALRVLCEHAAPGAWANVRPPSRKELAATMVLAMDLTEASVKVRTGDPGDEPDEIAAGGVWAGVLPVHTGFGVPKPSDDLEAIPIPDYVLHRGPKVTPGVPDAGR